MPDLERRRRVTVVEEAQRASGAMATAILAARRADDSELADELTRIRDDWARTISRWQPSPGGPR